MDHFGRLLKQSNNNMMRHFDQFARQYDLTGNQMAVIDFITNHVAQEVFQRDIEHEFEIQRSTTTVLLQRMEKKGLIERHTSSKDARQYLTGHLGYFCIADTYNLKRRNIFLEEELLDKKIIN